MTALPTGTVTFLFTDIEGSTARWEQQRQAMQAALARHDAILREVIAVHGGHVFKTVGDAFCAAFATAPAALEAALAAQRALAGEDWGEGLGPLRVRMALHTGAAEERDGDYFGPPLHRVARLLSTGHGGQILLSHVTEELVCDQLPAGVELRDVGEHRLKDLGRPEHVFQLVAPDLQADFPPLKSLDARPNNLPMQPTPLIGREREVTAAAALLQRPDVRLLTLTGAGGIGKTRLGLAVAAALQDELADGIFFVGLAPIFDPALILSTIAKALGVVETGAQALLGSVQAFLKDKQLLLVLDNFEQVLAAGLVIADLLQAAHGLKVLVTSRAPLRLQGEHEMTVPPLRVPGRPLPGLEALSQFEAVRLFIERAQAVKASFQVTNANAPAVAEICARLDGLPLAIALAAARVKILSPDALLQRLGSRLKVLTGGTSDLPARQQTLRATIDWSYSLLDPGEQMLFVRLAVFVGGRTLEAAEAICNCSDDLATDVLDGIQSLVDKSLLQQEDGPMGEPRFMMLETIHEYARERLMTSPDAGIVQRSHAEYFLELAERADPELLGPEQGAWLDQLEAEHGNFRAALEWSRLAEKDDAAEMPADALGLRLAAALSRFWEMRAHFTEGRRWLERLLDDSAGPGNSMLDAVRAKAYTGAGTLAWHQGDYEAGRRLHGAALALYRVLEDRPGVAFALNSLGAQDLQQGNVAQAAGLFEESLALARELGDKRLVSFTIHNLAEVARVTGDYARADLLYRESLSLFQERGELWGVAVNLRWMGEVARLQAQYEQATALYRESLTLCQQLGEKAVITECLEGFAAVAGAQGGQTASSRSARLWGAAEALRESIGVPIPPVDRVMYEQALATSRARADERMFAAAWAEGRAMTLEQAIAAALESIWEQA